MFSHSEDNYVASKIRANVDDLHVNIDADRRYPASGAPPIGASGNTLDKVGNKVIIGGGSRFCLCVCVCVCVCVCDFFVLFVRYYM